MFRTFMVPVALVSLIDRLVACSARIAADKWTHAQTKHCNPCCAYVPRVKCLENVWSVCIKLCPFLSQITGTNRSTAYLQG